MIFTWKVLWRKGLHQWHLAYSVPNAPNWHPRRTWVFCQPEAHWVTALWVHILFITPVYHLPSCSPNGTASARRTQVSCRGLELVCSHPEVLILVLEFQIECSTHHSTASHPLMMAGGWVLGHLQVVSWPRTEGGVWALVRIPLVPCFGAASCSVFMNLALSDILLISSNSIRSKKVEPVEILY